jgi:hypothetical protein
MKASGLIGLIVVILFFMVHTFLGAIAPKKPAQNAAAQDPGAGPGVAAPPAPAGPAPTGDQAPTGTDSAFPIDKVPQSKDGSLAKALAKDVHDPFVPLPKENTGNAAAPRPPDSNVGIWPNQHAGVGEVKPFGPSSNGGYLPPIQGGAGFAGPGGPVGPAAVTVTRIEPEIKVVGLVDGEPPIATLTVAGRSTLVHRGDALASGYRVLDISPDGVVIRCGKERKTLRVGGVVNEKSETRAEAH